MPKFLAEVQNFCKAKRGRVSELAQYLGVAQPHVSAWLTGRQEPSGENTLQMQKWMAQTSSPTKHPTSPWRKRQTPRHTATPPQHHQPEETPVWLL